MNTSRLVKRKNVEIDNANHMEKLLVVPYASGQGLPYAPVDWPEPGDTWRWKVGGRISLDEYFIDRYLYLPPRLKSIYKQNQRFTSKRALQGFITAFFPNQDVDKLLSSFCWKIPVDKKRPTNKRIAGVRGDQLSFESDELQSDSYDDDDDDDVQSGLQPAIFKCKAGNKWCSSTTDLAILNCQLCCKEDSFCRDCCCTLCFRSVNVSGNGSGLDYIRCEAPVGGANFVCGHIFHVRCGLQAFTAGTVGGSIDLDAEFLCRTCNSKTDLIPHVEKVLKACHDDQSSSSSYKVDIIDVQKWLWMCGKLLYGSTRTKAINLMHFVQLTMEKIKKGMSLEDVWKVKEVVEEENISPSSNINVAGTAGDMNGMMVDDAIEASKINEDKLGAAIGCLKLDHEVLKEVGQYQENENRMAKEITSSFGKRPFLKEISSSFEEAGDHVGVQE